MAESSAATSESTEKKSLPSIAKTVSSGVFLISLVVCLILASINSSGLVEVRVTALNPDAEPQDVKIPFLKKKDVLPDYEVVVRLTSGRQVKLGTKPNTSATDGLSWTLQEAVPLSEIASIRLQDQDKLVSDTIAEVQINGESAESDGFRFNFTTERSIGVGMRFFFRTPIGEAIQ